MRSNRVTRKNRRGKRSAMKVPTTGDMHVDYPGPDDESMVAPTAAAVEPEEESPQEI